MKPAFKEGQIVKHRLRGPDSKMIVVEVFPPKTDPPCKNGCRHCTANEDWNLEHRSNKEVAMYECRFPAFSATAGVKVFRERFYEYELEVVP